MLMRTFFPDLLFYSFTPEGMPFGGKNDLVILSVAKNLGLERKKGCLIVLLSALYLICYLAAFCVLYSVFNFYQLYPKSAKKQLKSP
jgi:hypothetical protein